MLAKNVGIIRYTDVPRPPPTSTTLQNPFSVTTPGPTSQSQKSLQMVPSFKGHLLLPHATAEYKKCDDPAGKALNQGRMYIVSVISFYSSFGIENFPFYCLVASGTLGAILMGWKSSKFRVSATSFKYP
jgi:hypothetical protein